MSKKLYDDIIKTVLTPYLNNLFDELITSAEIDTSMINPLHLAQIKRTTIEYVIAWYKRQTLEEANEKKTTEQLTQSIYDIQLEITKPLLSNLFSKRANNIFVEVMVHFYDKVIVLFARHYGDLFNDRPIDTGINPRLTRTQLKKIRHYNLSDAYKSEIRKFDGNSTTFKKVVDIMSSHHSESDKDKLLKHIFSDKDNNLDKTKMNTYLAFYIKAKKKAEKDLLKAEQPQESALEQTSISHQTSIIRIDQPTIDRITALIENGVDEGDIIRAIFNEVVQDNPDMEHLDIIHELQSLINQIAEQLSSETSGAGRNHKSKNNKWISHVKKIQNQHKCTYSQALKLASKTYKK